MGGGGVDLSTYRQRIGQFVAPWSTYHSSICLWDSVCGKTCQVTRGQRRMLYSSASRRGRSIPLIVVHLFLLLRATALPIGGDVELNPGPPPYSSIVSKAKANLNLNSNVNRQPQRSRGCNSAQSGLRTPRVSVLQLNARSLLPNISELADVVSTLEPDIIAVTETWLTPTVPDGALVLPDFDSVVRIDRKHDPTSNTIVTAGGAKQSGGGVLLLRNSVQYSIRNDLRTWSESVWVDIQLRYSGSLLVGCFYSPPHGVQAVLRKPWNRLLTESISATLLLFL